ncbi:hypothetical protein [Actinoplanes sp. N902-109]|uniref:hypothetical protein n=1 Tax=Actinoplanes sp. (strain N902-109) TaxID=649831 RepID=UPI00059EDBC1|nr:hypothetical protein [Actinoplanes sp. N902-109]
MRTQLRTARAAAVFASDLATGSRPDVTTVTAAIAAAVHARGGTRGCIAAVATAYGDYPESAARRMRWALGTVTTAYDRRPRIPDRELAAA